MRQKASQRYCQREAEQRFEAALRGAKLAAHQPAKSMTPKQPEAQRKKTKAAPFVAPKFTSGLLVRNIPDF
jgi:hypothetical protein